MNELCHEAIFSKLSKRKRSLLKSQIPAFRHLRPSEHFSHIRISWLTSPHRSASISFDATDYDLKFNPSTKQTTIRKCKYDSDWVYQDPVDYTDEQIVQFFIQNKMNRMGNVVERLEIVCLNKVNAHHLHFLHPIATIKQLKLWPPIPDLIPKFTDLNTLVLIDTHDSIDKSIIKDVMKLPANLNKLVIRGETFPEEILSVKAPILSISEHSPREEDDHFFKFAKKFQNDSAFYEKGSYYKCAIRSGAKNDYFHRIFGEFPGINSDFRLQIGESKVLVFEYYRKCLLEMIHVEIK